MPDELHGRLYKWGGAIGGLIFIAICIAGGWKAAEMFNNIIQRVL